MPSNSPRTHKLKDQPSPHRKPNSFPKTKPPFASPHYLIVDTTLPSHVFNNRSLFTTYVSARKLYRTVLGTNIIVEGIGDVHIRVVMSGKSILLRFRDSWHVPSSPHHLFSCSTVVSLGHQVMIAGRSPRMIFSHKHRLVVPDLPKYIPFTRLGGLTVLRFDIPAQNPISPQPASITGTTLSTIAPTVFSLQTSCQNRPFAGLAFNQSLLPLPLPSSSQSSALATIDFKCKPEATTALVANFNTLLDSVCARTLSPRLPPLVLLLLVLLRLWGVAMLISVILMLIIM
jgi:hypothetical protein